MKKEQFTKDEHYIPVFYLKQFSPDGDNIYQYDALNNIVSPDVVPIKSICYKKNLYEFKNDSGEYVERNIIENSLRDYEAEFANTITRIKANAKNKDNYNTLCFLSPTEKLYLLFFISTLILRNPDVIDVAIETALEVWNNSISETMAKNIALQSCLPLYNIFNPNDKNMLSVVLNRLSQMSFQVMVYDDDIFFTSDKPLFINGKKDNFEIDNIALPLSPRIMLSLQKLSETDPKYKNRLIHIDTNMAHYYNAYFVSNNNRWVYSKYQFTKSQIKWINKKRAN